MAQGGYASCCSPNVSALGTQWVQIKQGEVIPDTAVAVGNTKTDGKIVVGRFNGEAGKVNANGVTMCHFWGHLNKSQDSAEILCSTAKHCWIPIQRGMPIPSNAIKAGETSSDGVTYIGRLQGEAGKINTSDGNMYNFWAHNFWTRKKAAEILVLEADGCKGAAWDEASRGMKGTVICVAGLASAALQVRTVGEDTWRPSYCHIGPLVAHPATFMNELKLRPIEVECDDGVMRTCVADQEGLELRAWEGIGGLSTLNPDEMGGKAPKVAVWKAMVDRLIEHYNPVGFNYDWRKWGCPRYSKSLPKEFSDLVEHHFHATGPVTVLAHSMGAPVALYCLNTLGEEWQKDYVKDIILVAPSPMGSPCMVPSYSNNPVTAVKAIFHAPQMVEHKVAETTVTWAGMVSEMPMLVGGLNTYPDYPIVITSEKEYYAADMGEFLQKLADTMEGRNFAAALWPSVNEIASAMHAPAVRTSIIYNNAQDTISQVSYKEVGDDLTKAPKVTKYEKGDNTLLASSVESLGVQWKDKGADVRFFNTPDKEDHKNLIVGEYTIKTVMDILEGQELKERTLASSFDQ